MAKKVSQYTTQATVLAAGDLIDLTKLISTGPNVYESQKADANLLAGWNLFGQDQTMPAPRLHNLGNNQLSLTNGRLLLKGSDNIATDLLKLESLAGTEVFKAQNDGTIKISNAFTLPTSDGITGQALLTNGSGAVSWGSVALNNIYTSNGSLTSARTVDLDGNNFEILDTGVTNTASFRINSGSGAVVDRNSVASTFVCRANSVNHTEFGPVTTYIAATNIQLGSNTNDNGLQIETDRVRYYTTEIGTGGVAAGQIHDIHANSFLIYKRGFERPYNSYFVIGSASQVGSEDISLQGETVVKGVDTLSTSTALSIYDGDAVTPTKMWDFTNDGFVHIGQNTKFEGGAYGFTFNRTSTANNTLVLQNANTNFAVFRGVQTEIFSNTIHLGSSGGTNGLKIQGRRIRYYTDVGSSGVIHDINSDRFALFGQGFSKPSNSYFSVGSYFRLGSEDISLQGSVLMNSTVNMPNLPTSASGLSSGDVWNDGGTLKIV